MPIEQSLNLSGSLRDAFEKATIYAEQTKDNPDQSKHFEEMAVVLGMILYIHTSGRLSKYFSLKTEPLDAIES